MMLGYLVAGANLLEKEEPSPRGCRRRWDPRDSCCWLQSCMSALTPAVIVELTWSCWGSADCESIAKVGSLPGG